VSNELDGRVSEKKRGLARGEASRSTAEDLDQCPAGALRVAAGRVVVPWGAGAEGAEAEAGRSGAGIPDFVL
jgi:hypothetical protein